MDKDVLAALAEIDKVNSYTSFLDDDAISSKVDSFINTGSYALNAVCSGKLRSGGVPLNRVTVFAGPSRCGKTFILLNLIREAQQMGLIPVVFDSENAISPESAAKFGIDLSKVKYSQVFTIEETRNAAFKLFQKIKELKLEGKFALFIDSLGNLESEVNMTRMGKDSTAVDMGSNARAMKSLMKTLTGLGGQTKTTVVCSNHIYDNPAEMFPSLEKAMPGGKSLVYLPSVTIQMGLKPVKGDDGKTLDGKLAAGQKSYVGAVNRVLAVKNRFVKQFVQSEIYISFEKGLNKYYGLLDLAVGLGVIDQNGATYTLGDRKLGYQKNFRHDTSLWEKEVIPLIEEAVSVEWAYSNKPYEDAEDDSPEE